MQDLQEHDTHRNALLTFYAEERYAILHIKPVALPDQVCEYQCVPTIIKIIILYSLS